ncbi:MAG: nucleotidyltransferase family protein [Candidatus Hodarchaeales archaeon]
MNGIKVNDYLENVISYLKRNHPSRVLSVVLFGSFAGRKDEKKSVSDVDLLIIIDNKCSIDEKDEIIRGLYSLEKRHFGYTISSSNSFIKGLQKATGMFVNNFVCYYDQIVNRDFCGVFGVNRAVSKLLAPSTSVWISLLRQHKILYGKDIFKDWNYPLRMNINDLFKSFLMNTLLALGAIFICFVYESSVKFSMEAMKWSLFTWRNYHRLDMTSPNDIMKRYVQVMGHTDKMLVNGAQLFIKYRTTCIIEKNLSIFALFFVFKIHTGLLAKNRKI